MTDGQDVEVGPLTGSYPDGVWTDIVPGDLVRLRLVSDGSVAGWGFAADAHRSVPYTALGFSPHPYPNDAKQTWSFNNMDAGAEATRLHSRAWTWKRALTGLSSSNYPRRFISGFPVNTRQACGRRPCPARVY